MMARIRLISGAINTVSSRLFPTMLVVAACLLALQFVPNWYWMSIDEFAVDDAVLGSSPLIHFKRHVRRAFVMQWHNVVHRAEDPEGDGHIRHFYGMCVADGTVVLYPDRPLPWSRLDLDWWLGYAKCDLQPGSYFIEAVWVWNGFGTTHILAANSNVFKITSK